MSEGLAPSGLRWWFPRVPAQRLATLRILVGTYSVVYLAVRIPYFFSFTKHPAAQFQPIGLLSFMDAPFEAGLFKTLVVLALTASIAFLLGFRYRVLGPVFALLLLVLLTYVNSWGGILHTDNLWVLHVLILSLAPAADALSLDAKDASHPEHFKYGWAIRLMCWVCVCTYFLAAVAKLKNGGFGFIGGESLRNYVAMDNARKIELGSLHSPIAGLFLPYAFVFQVLATVSLALELGAPLVMLQSKVARIWAVGMWGFHVGVLALMAILFPYPVSFIAFAPFFRAERLVPLVRRIVRRSSPETTALAASSG